MLEDKLLILRCKCGSKAAFQRIYEKYEGDLRTLAANLIFDKTAAEDIVHDVFVSLFQIMKDFELRSSLPGYLKTCVANKARNLAESEAEQLVSNEDPIQLVEQSEALQKLNFAMDRLPYEQREAIVLYLHGQMKFKAIAKLQQVSIKTAHCRYRAGLDGLRSILNGEVE
jgi:RNA polymerase sigma-70 factor (ECF subfamily)